MGATMNGAFVLERRAMVINITSRNSTNFLSNKAPFWSVVDIRAIIARSRTDRTTSFTGNPSCPMNNGEKKTIKNTGTHAYSGKRFTRKNKEIAATVKFIE
jgi:hypothetical protein